MVVPVQGSAKFGFIWRSRVSAEGPVCARPNLNPVYVKLKLKCVFILMGFFYVYSKPLNSALSKQNRLITTKIFKRCLLFCYLWSHGLFSISTNLLLELADASANSEFVQQSERCFASQQAGATIETCHYVTEHICISFPATLLPTLSMTTTIVH